MLHSDHFASSRDVYVLIPGIMGSVLRKDGRDLWALSAGALTSFLRRRDTAVEELVLGDDDPALDDLGDGITAPEIIEGVTLFPGVHKCDSYARLRRFLGESGLADPSSVVTLPYDWRRDNCVAARKLARLVESRLRQRREEGATDALAVLVAHSMGGLVARYYLEVLGGWRHCRALVTFGTPHRGSVAMLEYLANGYKQLFLEFSEVVRSCTSAYQLLPIYPAVEVADGRWERPGEAAGLPNIPVERAARGLAFHREIEAAQAANARDPAYQRQGYSLIPVVGVGQPTLQAARLRDGRLVTDRDVPPYFDPVLADGDSSVPRASAIPLEMSSGRGPLLYIAESHGTLPSRREALDQMLENVRQAGIDLEAIRAVATEAPVRGLALELEDAYRSGEPVALAVRGLGLDGVRDVVARVEPLTEGAPALSLPLLPAGDGWAAAVEGLVPGGYRVEVSARGTAGLKVASVSDLFEVVAA